MKEQRSSISAAGSALVLSASRGAAARDVKSLEALNVENVVVMSSGAWAAKYLSRHPVDVIVCDGKLVDMTGEAFLKSLRTYPGLDRIPAVMVSKDGTKKSVLGARDAGFSGYVLRPYDLRTFAERVIHVVGESLAVPEPEPEAEPEQAMAVDKAVEQEKKAWAAYTQGLRHLARGMYDMAADAFKAAIRLKEFFAEAYEGLARAWRGKGSVKRYSVFMKKSAVLYARNKQPKKARQAYDHLLRVNPEAGNPFSSAGMRLVRKGEVASAAGAYSQALVLASSTRDVYADIARACHFTEDPEASCRRLCAELGVMRGFPDSATLFDRVMGPVVEKQPEAAAAGGKLLRVPETAKVFLAVAKHTMSVYRKGLAAGEV